MAPLLVVIYPRVITMPCRLRCPARHMFTPGRHEHGAHQTATPNKGYELFMRRVWTMYKCPLCCELHDQMLLLMMMTTLLLLTTPYVPLTAVHVAHKALYALPLRLPNL